MAVVFLARDSRTGADVALKLVRDGSAHEEREILEAETRGAQLQRQFSSVSSRVPQVYEFGTDGGYFYVAMEYLEGENLSDAIARGPMPMDRALSIAGELCRFVEDAHGFEPEGGDRPLRSLLHGDLKPRNIRLTPAGQVKVLDFGIAKALSLSRKVTRNDFGSVAYLSPERLESGDVDQYADFWAIGVMLYELLTGEQAFRAPDTRRLEKLIVSRSQPPLLAELEPVSLRAVLCRLLAPEPAERYDSGRAIREDIERCVSGVATEAEQQGWPRNPAPELPDDATRATHPPAIDPEQTRRTTKAVVPPPIPPPIPTLNAPIEPPPLPGPPATTAAGAGTKPVAVKPPSKMLRRLKIAVTVLVIILFMRELGLSSDAERVAGAAPTTELDEIGTLWNQYDSLSRRSVLGFGTGDLASALTTQTEALADRVFANYRAPQPTVREAQWRQVRTALARALPTRRRNARLRAMVRYCDGPLHRIDGEARKARRLPAEAQREFADAVAAFREAAELQPDWADPYLGLARTFIYGLEDVERGADAMLRAERAGYTPGSREAAQLGDGYRTRADTLARSARDVTGLSQERDYLTRAAESYRQALEHYGKATDYSGVPRNIALAQRSLTTIERRLEALLLFSPPSFEAENKPWR